MKVVIMAGGKGTRINSMFPDIPKPLIPIKNKHGDEKPVLEWEICSLRDQGFKEIILTVAHFAEKIIEYFGDGSSLGVKIDYYREERPLGNAGALLDLKLNDDFILLNGDSIFDIDFNRMIDYHRAKNALVTLFTHPNNHPYDSGLIVTGDNNEVLQWLTKDDTRPKWYRNRVNAGVHILSPEVLKMFGGKASDEKIDLDRQILKPLCGTGKMFAYDSPEYVKDMGTPDRYEQVCRDSESGIIVSRNLHNKQKAIFLDRDGTINVEKGFLCDIDDFELIEGVADAIRRINNSGYLCIIATNQPVVARGEVSFEDLNNIHNKMETLLGEKGAYIDALYYCPHHPDKGFHGEIPELKIECECRKPKPGMLIKAAKDYNIDLASSWMIGDFEKDIKAGKNAGCYTALIGNEDYGEDLKGNNLKEIIELIIK